MKLRLFLPTVLFASLLLPLGALLAQPPTPPMVSDIVPLGTGQYIEYNQYDTAYMHAPAVESHASFTVLANGQTYMGDTGVSVVADTLGKGDPTGGHILHYRFNSSGDMEAFADTAFIASQIPSTLTRNVQNVPNTWVPVYKTSAGSGVSYSIMTLTSQDTLNGIAATVTITLTGEYMGMSSVTTPSGNYNTAYRFIFIGNLSAFGGLVSLTDTETDWLVTGAGIVKTQLPIDSTTVLGNGISVGGREKEMVSFGVRSAGVSELPSASNTVQLSPNPASDEVTLTLGRPAHRVFLYDGAGRMVRSFELAGQSASALLSVQDLPNGVYLARVEFERGANTSAQIVVQH